MENRILHMSILLNMLITLLSVCYLQRHMHLDKLLG